MNKRAILTDRDKKLLCLLFENKVMARRQIVHEVFPGLDSGNVSHRLSRILNSGYARDYMDKRFSIRDTFYELSDQGNQFVRSIYPMEFTEKPTRSYTYGHDVGLVDLRQKIQNKKSLKKYVTENVLQFCLPISENELFKPFVDIMSDVVLQLEVNGKIKTGALEFEPSEKNHARYRDKVLSYYVKEKIGFVIYVCTNETTIKTIQSIENEIKPEGNTKLYFSLLKNVLSSTDKLTFLNRSKAILEIS